MGLKSMVGPQRVTIMLLVFYTIQTLVQLQQKYKLLRLVRVGIISHLQVQSQPFSNL